MKKEEQLELITKMFLENKTYSEMARALDLAKRTIANKVLMLKREGKLPDVYRSVDYTKKGKITASRYVDERNNIKELKAKAEEQGLKYCDTVVARKCLYGTCASFESQGLCNYITLEGHSRGCSWTACSKYKEAESEKQKLKFQRMCNMQRG